MSSNGDDRHNDTMGREHGDMAEGAVSRVQSIS